MKEQPSATTLRERLIDVAFGSMCGTKSNVPMFRLIAEGLIDPSRWGLSQLKSDHIANDNWLFRPKQ